MSDPLKRAAAEVARAARALLAIPDPPLGKFRCDAYDARARLRRALDTYDQMAATEPVQP